MQIKESQKTSQRTRRRSVSVDVSRRESLILCEGPSQSIQLGHLHGSGILSSRFTQQLWSAGWCSALGEGVCAGRGVSKHMTFYKGNTECGGVSWFQQQIDQVRSGRSVSRTGARSRSHRRADDAAPTDSADLVLRWQCWIRWLIQNSLIQN